MSQVRLTRKLALVMNGIDVSKLKVGDTLDLSLEQAEMMILNGWAEAIDLDLVPPGLVVGKPSQTDLPK